MDTANRLTIAFVIDYYRGPNAGTERQLHLMAEGLRRAGIGVRLVVFRHSEYTASGAFPAPLQVLDVGRVASPRSWLRVFRWAQKARSEGVSVVHVFFNDPALFVPACLAAAGLPCVVARRDMGFWYTPLRLMLLRRMQPFVSRLVANSKAVAEHCGSAEGYAPEKRTVIPNAVARLDLPSRRTHRETFTIGLVANIRPIKRISDAIHALSMLVVDGRQIRLRVIGGGDASELLALAARLDVADRVEFPGPSNDVGGALAEFDVALMCSESEGLSNAIMEYMQAGLPVIATDTGGNAELVTQDETGFLYPVGDIERLATSLARIHDNPDLAAGLGAAGARRIREGFGVDRIVTAYASLYGDIARGNGAPPLQKVEPGQQAD